MRGIGPGERVQPVHARRKGRVAHHHGLEAASGAAVGQGRGADTVRFGERLREQADGHDHAAVHERRVVQRLAAVHLAGAEQHEVLEPQIVHLAAARHAPPPSHHLADGPEIVEMERERLHDALERDELHARARPERRDAPVLGAHVGVGQPRAAHVGARVPRFDRLHPKPFVQAGNDTTNRTEPLVRNCGRKPSGEDTVKSAGRPTSRTRGRRAADNA